MKTHGTLNVKSKSILLLDCCSQIESEINIKVLGGREYSSVLFQIYFYDFLDQCYYEMFMISMYFLPKN